jgi:hypothetical protein
MLEHYGKAPKALDIDIDKIILDLVRPLVREELTREPRMKMKKEKTHPCSLIHLTICNCLQNDL